MLTKNHGYDFQNFLFIKESDIHKYQPLAGSYAVIQCDERYLFCFNTWRKQWELPAGQREEHETPKECALRELYEETGQKLFDLEFKGLLKSKNSNNNQVKYNPVYFTKVEKLQPFQKNDETSEILLWDLISPISYIDELDFKLLDSII